MTPPPDTGYAWLVAISASMTQFVTLGYINSFGVFFGPMMKEFGVGNGSLAAVVSLANFVAPMVGIFAGHLADHHGFRGLIFAAAMCQFTAFFLSSFIFKFSLLLLSFGILAGVSAGCTISPSLGAVGQWFMEQRSTAMGIAFAGAGLGTVVLPSASTWLLSVYSWRYTFRLLSGLSAMVVVASFIMKRRVIHEELVIQSIGVYDILTTRGFVVLFLVGGLFSYGFFIPIVHIAMYAQRMGTTPVQAGYCLAVLGLFTTIGNVVWGSAADRFSNLHVFRLCHGASGVMLCLWPFCTTFGQILAFASACGFFNGGCVTCYPALAAEHFPSEKLSAAISLIYTGFGVGSLVGPTVSGLLVDVTAKYTLAAWAGGGAFFAALLVASFLGTAKPQYHLQDFVGMDMAPPTAAAAAVVVESGSRRVGRKAEEYLCGQKFESYGAMDSKGGN